MAQLKGVLTREYFDRKKRDKRQRENKLVMAWEYGGSLEQHPPGLIMDSETLPYPKQDLLDALLFAIANAENKEIASALCVAALSLAQYQDGVGIAPLTVPHVDPNSLSNEEALAFAKGWESSGMSHFINMMASESKEIFTWTKRAMAANLHLQPVYRKLWQRFRGQGLYGFFYKGYIDFQYHPELR